MPARLTATRFVGRQAELAELELALSDAAAGRPGAILLGGDSGVGKTRLLAEFEQRVADASEDALFLRGDSLEQGEGELPYAPLLGALRPLIRARSPILSELSPGSRARLATLLPSLRQDEARSEPDGQTDQLQLFEALLELLDLLSQQRPLVLVLEDIHWADRSTRTFIAFAAASLREERVLLVFTYRTDELHRRHPLRPLLAELDRSPRTRRMQLSPFDRDELAEALADILGARPDRALIDRLAERTEGNPLFAEELLAAGLDGRGAAPQSLNDAFILRTERLSKLARAVLRALAVGAKLDEQALAAVVGFDGAELHEALREAVTENVLTPADEDRFQFRHALLREAVYEDLLPGERSDLHLRTGQALEQLPPSSCIEDQVERIAQTAAHYAAAGDQPAALRATVTAAAKARCVYAYGEVAELLERALELWPRVQHAQEVAGADRVELAARAAQAHYQAGNYPRAEQLLERSLEAVEGAEHPYRRARLLSALAKAQWKLNRGNEALETAQQALALAPRADDPERIALQGWLARTRVLRGRYREAIAVGEEALAAARDCALSEVVGEVLNTVGMARIAVGEVDAGVALMREAMDVARERDDPDALGTAYCNLADLLNLAGRTKQARATIEEAFAVLPRAPRLTFRWLRLTRSEMAFETGDWDVARAELAQITDNPPGIPGIYMLLRSAEQALADGDQERAAELLEAAAPLARASSESQWHGLFGSLRGELHRRRGELEEARRAVSEALDQIEVCTDDVMRIARVSAVGLAVEADTALRGSALRDDAARADALLRAEFHLDRLRAAAEDGGPVEAAWLAVGEAEFARAREDQVSPGLWDRAADAFSTLGRPYCAAQLRWRQAEALVGAERRKDAAPLAAEALAVARRLGAGWLAGELEALIARGRLALERENDAAAPAEEPEQLPFGLTPRELQVLGLLAQGATNRQIGAALYMAEKTASVHVSRILAKLNVQSRTQAAAVAHRLHLAGAELGA